jgi:hypothetical protein
MPRPKKYNQEFIDKVTAEWLEEKNYCEVAKRNNAPLASVRWIILKELDKREKNKAIS